MALIAAVVVSLLVLAAAFAVGGAYYVVARRTSPRLFDDVASLPHRPVGVVLGTTPVQRGGAPNAYFRYRIEAAAEIYHAGKVDYLLLSGDNRARNYNEPRYMKDALLERGIPGERIYLDAAGLRTLDSVVRASRIFGQDHFTVISQEFHNRRAVFIAEHFDIDAIGYNARDVRPSSGLRTKAREALARVRMILDLYLLDTQPEVMGDSVRIGKS
ncbi:MAG: YdcF family protein [Deltaproteobacteria bacterium]|nr:YdcF family protein [Deltaproteobacteria bacterium]